MPQVSDVEKKHRSKVLNELSKKLESQFLTNHLKQVIEVLTEEIKDEATYGFTSNYIRVKIPQKLELNKFYKIKTLAVADLCLVGEAVENKAKVVTN